MDVESTGTDQELLAHARRQTKALESIRTILMGFVVVLIVCFGIAVLYALVLSAGA